MTIHEEQRGEVLVLAPDGSLTGGEDVAALETRLASAVKARPSGLVVDGTAVDELTSAAIRALLMATRKLARTKGRLVLCALTPHVQRAFALSGFDRDFTVVATRDEAVRAALAPAGAGLPAVAASALEAHRASRLHAALGSADVAADARAGAPPREADARAVRLLAALAAPAAI